MTDHNMTPVEASTLAGELLAHMDRLSTLDIRPITNAADIETLRASAEAAARDLLGYLLASSNFAPVVEDTDAVQEWEL